MAKLKVENAQLQVERDRWREEAQASAKLVASLQTEILELKDTMSRLRKEYETLRCG